MNRMIADRASGRLSRRQFVRRLAGLGLGAVGLALMRNCGSQPPAPGGVKQTLETTTLRVPDSPAICTAPQYLAEDFLKSDGFTDVQYVKGTLGPLQTVAAGQADIGITFSGPLIVQIDAGDPIVVLAGVHSGCFELFGTDEIRAIRDLKGKIVAIRQLGSSQHVFLASMVAYVGLDPRTDITWVTHPSDESIGLLAEGKIDAYMAFPPEPQELRAKHIGHLVVNSMMDKPWSQYFCCMVAANREFVQNNPVATKRALRAILKAADICTSAPERAARFTVESGFTKNYDYALDIMKHLPYYRWREYDPVDTLRFYSLRLRDAGMVKHSPDELIAQGADWRLLNDLKKELPVPVSSARNGQLFCRIGEPSLADLSTLRPRPGQL
jgi:NitT/TauT family transport system substrate-binding protein